MGDRWERLPVCNVLDSLYKVDGCLLESVFVSKKGVAFLTFYAIIQQSVSCHEACSCNAGKSF